MRVHVLRVRDRDQELVAVDRIRDRADALEDVEGDRLGGLRRDAASSTMSTTGRLWRSGERPGDALALGEPFLDERLGERARPGAVANEGDLVGRQDSGGLDDVGDELGQRIDLERTLELSGAAPSCAAICSPDTVLNMGGRSGSIPRMRYRRRRRPA